jgi:hypothetical protein
MEMRERLTEMREMDLQVQSKNFFTTLIIILPYFYKTEKQNSKSIVENI